MTRQEYGVARAASIELAFSICQNLRGVPTVSTHVALNRQRLQSTRTEPPGEHPSRAPLSRLTASPLARIPPQRNADGEPVHLSHAEREKIMRQNEHARKTLIRYLNFAHLVRCVAAAAGRRPLPLGPSRLPLAGVCLE